MMVCAECGNDKVCRVVRTRMLCEACGHARDQALHKENAMVSKGFFALMGLVVLFLLIGRVSGCGN